MALDIVPELLADIEKDFNDRFNRSNKLRNIRKLIDEGKATYADANEYAVEVGTILAQSFKNNISSDILPNERMYYNIAERILNPTLSNNQQLISRTTAEIQTTLNLLSGYGLRGLEATLNQDRIDGLIERVSTEELFDDVAWILDEPVINFSQSVVDDVLETNVNFQGESGLQPTITRTLVGGACDWCVSVAGNYKYPNVPQDVYRRHDRCRCTVEYNQGDRKQNVWSKEWQ